MFFLPVAPLDIVVYLSALSLMGCPAGVCRPRSAVCVIDHAEALNRCQQPRGRVHNPPVGRGELKKHRLQSRLSLPVRRLISGLPVIRRGTRLGRLQEATANAELKQFYFFNSASQSVTKWSGACVSSSAWFTSRRFPSIETSNDDPIPGVLARNRRWGLPTATSDPFALIGHAKKSSV